MKLVLAVISLLAVVAAAAGACPKFMVIAPNVFNVGERVAISVLLRTAGSDVELSVWSKGLSNSHSSQTKHVQKDQHEKFELIVDETKLINRDDNGNFYVELNVKIGTCKKSKEILVNTRTGTVFVSTDKPIYLPRQYVHVNIFTLDEFRRGKTMPVRVEVKNVQGVIMQRTESLTVNGLHAETYQLSKRPTPGNWSIIASYGKDYSNSRTTYIEIKDYVLPHFEVQITEAPTTIATTGSLTVKFSARYSFGAPVEGHAFIVFRLFVTRDEVFGERRFAHGMTIVATKEHTYMLPDIETLFEKDDGESFAKFVQDGAKIQIEVHMTEKSTGIRYTAYSSPIHFLSSPYRISFRNTPVTFNPGQQFTVKMEVAGSGIGNPLQGLGLEGTVYQQDKKTEVDSPIQFLERGNGQYEFTLNVGSGLTKLFISIKVRGDNKAHEYSIPKTDMPEYMQLKGVVLLLEPGQSTRFTASLTHANNLGSSGMHYMLISGGRIIRTSKQDRIANNQISITESIGYNMAPHIRIVAWYFSTSRDELIVSSMLSPVEKRCHHPTKISLVETKVEPMKPFKLKYIGESNATLITYAVDKSVYFLSNRSRLTTKSFYEEFLTRDLGCAPGGGRTAIDVFTLAGLTIIDHRNSMAARREGFGCSKGRQRRSTSAERTANHQAIDESLCCEAGKRKTDSLDTRNYHAKQCLHGAKRHSPNVHCINAFASCCLERMEELTSNDHGRSENSENTEGKLKIKFLRNEGDSFPRSNFKESWSINTDLRISADGSLTREMTAPATITTWVMHATTLSPEEGMCVAQPLDVVSKKDLFVKLHLPKSAIMGEQIQIKSTVYNDGDSDQQVILAFLGPDKGCSEVPVGKWKEVRPQNDVVRSKKSWTVTWLFVPMEANSVDIDVKLISALQAPDIVTRTLRVVPSGSLKIAPILTVTQQPDNATAIGRITNSAGALNYDGIRQNTKDGRRQTGEVVLRTPAEAIRGSEIMSAHFIGDIMAPIVEGIKDGTEKLMRQAGGCGEQTMASVGPTVFTAQYLAAIGELVDDNEVNAKKHINQGIKRMLIFRNLTGGFSVWTDTPATIWLTGFALKTFSQARNFINTIDENVINTAASWLMQQLGANGLFSSVGVNHHHNMVGGVSAGPTLTAYIWIAIIDAGYYDQHKTTIDPSLDILAASVNQQTPSYTLAIVTLALAKANHPRATSVNDLLLQKAKYVPNKIPEQRYWPNGIPAEMGNQVEIEATGYGLLAQLALARPVADSNAIVEWLLRQRYGSNIFRTTQSTVVCLEGLAKYKIMAVGDVLDMTCSVFDASKKQLKSSIVLNNRNRLVQQKMDLTKQVGKSITIECAGIGRAYTTIETSYYVSRSSEMATAFELTAEAQEKEPGNKENMRITVCAKLKDQELEMQMPMLEIGIGSGYSPDDSTLKMLKEKSPQVDFYEIDNRSVVLYMSEISSAKLQCVAFDVTQDNTVEDLRPVPVKAYAYYNPDEIKSTIFYHPQGKNFTAKVHTQCKDDEICECLEHICPTCYGYDATLKDPKFTNETELSNYACLQRGRQRMHFVFKAMLKDVIIEDGEYKYTMLIQKVAKRGLEKKEDLEQMTRFFKLPRKCNPCNYVKNRTYIIMGQDQTRTNSESTDIDYYFTRDTYFVPIVPKKIAKAELRKEQRIINRQHKKFIYNMDGCKT